MKINSTMKMTSNLKMTSIMMKISNMKTTSHMKMTSNMKITSNVKTTSNVRLISNMKMPSNRKTISYMGRQPRMLMPKLKPWWAIIMDKFEVASSSACLRSWSQWSVQPNKKLKSNRSIQAWLLHYVNQNFPSLCLLLNVRMWSHSVPILVIWLPQPIR